MSANLQAGQIPTDDASSGAVPREAFLTGDPAPQDLKRRTVHGAMVSACSQVATLALRTGSMMILARLLVPQEFGLVGMVTAFTGILTLFRDAGLGMAAVQRASITDAQISTMFWINLGFGTLIAAMAAIAAPVLAMFYREPRLVLITLALALGFVFNGASAQHLALLQRAMRFKAIAVLNVTALIVSIAAAIGSALAGFGYWALVWMNIGQPFVTAVGAWVVTGWKPGRPRRRSGVRPMIRYGGALTLNNFIFYLAYNLDKILVGKFWGAEALGLYGRAYQWINLPTENLNSTIGLVGFPALSRLQNEPARFRSFFLKGYGFFLSIILPITVACALFAGDIVRVVLGPKWDDAVPIFRLLAPTILAFALTNPFAWVMLSLGHTTRNLKIGLMVAPVLLVGYLIGLPHGPTGVAAGFSIAMVLLVAPVIVWAKRGTLVSHGDILRVVAKPLASISMSVVVFWGVHSWIGQVQFTFLRLVVECAVLFGVHLLLLLFAMNQKTVYLDLLRTTGIWPIGARRHTKDPS